MCARRWAFDPDADPPKVLAIGPDPAGNFMEVIWLELDEVELVIRIDPELRAAIQARAESEDTTTSELIREAIRKFLEVA